MKEKTTDSRPIFNLHALIINLIATQNGRLRATQGHLAHAAFLNILQQVDPQVSAAIHDMKGRKPFTISPLEGFGRGQKGSLTIEAGQEGWLRVTLLDPKLFHTFIQYFLRPANKPAIKLENLTFTISEILSTPGSHKLAGYTSLTDLYTHWQEMGDIANHRKISLHFRTPTAFSMRSSSFRHMHILPDPALVFGQLADYWDNLTGSDTREAVRAFCADAVVVARYKLQSHIYQYRRSKQVGFAGKVTYEILDREATEMVQHLNCLADLAFYTGVGSKTTQGMGQVTRDSSPREAK
jgi:CRISPR-associated endoribonuclease Cas6